MSEREQIEQKIRDLKAELATYDYKTTKNTIAAGNDDPLPYSWAEIKEETQPIRDEINRLEELLREYE